MPVRRQSPKVTLIEEGMREGFQIEDARIPVEGKLRVLDALSKTGLSTIVVGSFVSPKWTPQMAGIDELVDRMTPVPGVRYTALALNDRGRERMAAHMPPLTPPSDLPATLVHLCDVFAPRNHGRTRQAEIHRRTALINAAWGPNGTGEFSLPQRMDFLQRQHDRWTAAGITPVKVFIGDPMGWNM